MENISYISPLNRKTGPEGPVFNYNLQIFYINLIFVCVLNLFTF